MLLFVYVFYKAFPLLKDAATTITVIDSSKVYLPQVSVSMPPQNITITPGHIPQVIDTLRIIEDYFARVEYRDSLENDTVKISLQEWVTKNRVESRNIRYQLKLPVTSYTVDARRWKLMIGGLVNIGNDAQVMPMVGWQNKKDQIYQVGYDPFNERVGVGIMVPVRLKR